MKRLVSVLALSLLTGCTSTSKSVGALTGPTIESAIAPSGITPIWDDHQLGHVVLVAAQPTTATFIVWKVLASGEQVNVGQQGYTLHVGSNDLTVGLIEACGVKYQRDVFFGMLPTPGGKPFTFSDLRNVPFLAPGQLWLEPACPIVPPVVPPPPPVVPPVVPPPPPVKPPVVCKGITASHYGCK